jgi:hypothetical protein
MYSSMRIWLYHSCRHSSVVAQDGLCEPSLDSGDTDQRNNILIDVVQELVENELRNSGRVSIQDPQSHYCSRPHGCSTGRRPNDVRT